MFKEFYEFENIPFTRSVPTEHLYHDNQNNDLIGRLKHTVNHQLFACVTGECGCGKTTLFLIPNTKRISSNRQRI